MFGVEFPLNTQTITIRPNSGISSGRPPDVWTGPATTTSSDLCAFLSASDVLRDWAKNNNKIQRGQKSAVLNFVLTCYAETGEKLSVINVSDIRIDFGGKRKKTKADDLFFATQQRSLEQDKIFATYLEKRDSVVINAMAEMHKQNMLALAAIGSHITGVITQQVEQQKAVIGLATLQLERTQDANDVLITELKLRSIEAERRAQKIQATATSTSALDSADKALGLVTKIASFAKLGGESNSEQKVFGDNKKADIPKLVASTNATNTADPQTKE